MHLSIYIYKRVRTPLATLARTINAVRWAASYKYNNFLMSNSHLHNSRKKQDEYDTRPEDVAAELAHYSDQLCGKTIYCNCDDPQSAFIKYFITKNNVWKS